MKSLMIVAILVLPVTLFACDKSADRKPEADNPVPGAAVNANNTNANTANGNAANAVVAVAPATPASDAIPEADLITPADFEDEAEKTVTAKTYKAELASLEADMAKD